MLNCNMKSLPFNKFSHNIYSQNGEDGILSEILNRLNLKNFNEYWCVEFGAWDGIFLSNTFSLVKKGWNAVYIEGDNSRYQDLLTTAKNNRNIVPIEAFVARNQSEETSLDNLLAATDVPKDFELLSIDIDSYDCEVWETLHNYFPKLVVIEINSSVPPGIFWRHGPGTPGNTFSETLKLAKSKGYILLCHTGNLIFIKAELINQLDFPTRFILNPNLLFIDKWISTTLSFVPRPLRPLALRLKRSLVGS
jgi:hypothetical protein